MLKLKNLGNNPRKAVGASRIGVRVGEDAAKLRLAEPLGRSFSGAVLRSQDHR